MPSKLRETKKEAPAGPRFSLASLLLLMAAAPLWAQLIYGAASGPFAKPLDVILAILSLIAGTAAIFFLLRDLRNGLALSALLAGLVLTGALVVRAIIST